MEPLRSEHCAKVASDPAARLASAVCGKRPQQTVRRDCLVYWRHLLQDFAGFVAYAASSDLDLELGLLADSKMECVNDVCRSCLAAETDYAGLGSSGRQA